MPKKLNRRDFLKLAAVAGGAAAFPQAFWATSLAAPGTRINAAIYDQMRAYVDLRFGMFIHFNMGTFHDAEWVNPGQDPLSFNPANLDCNQWATAAKSAGMTHAVLTTKHHDGFCLWPSAYTTYDVMSSSYPQDIVRKYVDAFRAQGLTPCFYFSIWDRQQGVESGSMTQADMDFVKGQLTELLTNYGSIPLLMTDGWAWQMGHQQAPYGEIRAHIKSLQPDCLMVDLNGLTEPWATDVIFFEEPKGIWAPAGNTYASCQGQNIVTTGWFWHPSTPGAAPMSTTDIVNTHLQTLEARYCTFLLNCPPNNQGRLDTNIVNRLAEVGPLWNPNTSRAPLPAQPDVLMWPVTPVSASATSGTAANAVDGKCDAGYQTLWQSSSSMPQSVTLDLGNVYNNIDMLTYLPRQDNNTTGNITSYRVYVSADGSNFSQVASGSWAADKVLKRVRFAATNARYVRLEAVAANGGFAAAHEIDCGGFAAKPVASGGPTNTPTRTSTIGVSTNTPTRTSTIGVPTNTPTRTPTRTATGPTPTNTRTRTPTRTPTLGGPTNTPTRTPTIGGPTNTPTRTPTIGGPTNTPTRTNTPVTPTPTPTSGGSTCSPVTATITAPFTFDGAGTFCWQIAAIPSHINSWNLTSLTVNGVNFTNIYVPVSSLPSKINGYWYISYNGPYAWSHFEAK